MDKDDEAFAEAFGDVKETRAQEPPKAQEPPPKEEAPPKVEETAQIKAEDPPQQTPPEPIKESEKPRVDPEQFKGYLDEREKRQAVERELKELRQQLAQQQQARPQEPPPDIYENPEGYKQHLEAQYETRLNQMKLQQSEFLATRDFGAELVNEVKEWAMRLDDATAGHLLKQASPFHAAVERYRQEQSAKTLKDYDYDLDKLKAKWLEELKAQQAPAGQQAPPQQQPVQNLPPKVAGEGGHVAQQPKQSEGDFFRSVFTR